MKAAAFAYAPARSADEAVALLAEHGDEAKLLAGGQSLVPLLNMRLARPEVVIDLRGATELAEVTTTPAGGVRYGAAVTHAAFEDRRVPDPTGGLLHHVAAGIGYRAVRNRGTLGGSLAHADSSAEWPVVMAAVGAQVVVRSARGERTIDARQLVQGFFTSAVEDDEVIVAVDVPASGPGVRWGFHKAARKPGEFAESLAVALVGPGRTDVWLGGARPVPVRVEVPAEGSVDDVRAAVWSLLDGGGGDDGGDGGERYRRHLHGVAAGRAVEAARSAAA